jgi:hypothetical protein
MTPRTMREGVGTREPCPIHPEPDLGGITFLPAMTDLKINTGPIPLDEPKGTCFIHGDYWTDNCRGCGW